MEVDQDVEKIPFKLSRRYLKENDRMDVYDPGYYYYDEYDDDFLDDNDYDHDYYEDDDFDELYL